MVLASRFTLFISLVLSSTILCKRAISALIRKNQEYNIGMKISMHLCARACVYTRTSIRACLYVRGQVRVSLNLPAISGFVVRVLYDSDSFAFKFPYNMT